MKPWKVAAIAVMGAGTVTLAAWGFAVYGFIHFFSQPGAEQLPTALEPLDSPDLEAEQIAVDQPMPADGVLARIDAAAADIPAGDESAAAEPTVAEVVGFAPDAPSIVQKVAAQDSPSAAELAEEARAALQRPALELPVHNLEESDIAAQKAYRPLF